MRFSFHVHDDRGDLVGTAKTPGTVPAMVERAIRYNLGLAGNVPSDGRFGRVNIALIADGRYIGQQTLQGIYLHPMVRRTLAKRLAEALADAARNPSDPFIPFDDADRPQA